MIAGLALAVFALGLFADSFVDEYAYISQSYYADLFFRGEFNHPGWLAVFALDLRPLPKYFIGTALRLAHLPMPGPANARDWYEHYAPFGSRATLTAARVPFVFVGALGCLALSGCGVLVRGRRVGTIAAILLMINPLYRYHAYRAMSDAPCETFLIAALGLGLWAGQRHWSGRNRLVSLLLVGSAGVCAGLSILCKFNGFLGLMVIACWSGLTLVAPRLAARRKLTVAAGTAVVIVTALATFMALDPALTARPRAAAVAPEARDLLKTGPIGRLGKMVEIRLEISRGQQARFRHNAITTATERLKVLAVQGFGRFSPFGPGRDNSEVRYEVRQDWGMIIWLPLVVMGLTETIRLGRVQWAGGMLPTAWAVVIWALVAWGVVGVYLPMAWNRYLLPIQPPNALLAAVGVSTLWDHLHGSVAALWDRIDVTAVGVFLILLGSYAFFWHSRDWNTASRLMLTYSLVDRGTVAITGLEHQTGDKARFQGHYYSDKLPGYPMLAAIPYAYAKSAFGIPAHPLGGAALAYWPADYWITLGTSGLLTAWAGGLLVLVARDLGCRPGASALTGLAYGLSTPAYVYATLAYGHQAAAFALLGSFFLLQRDHPRREALRVFLAGFLAASAAVIELQVGPVSAILGLYLVVQCGQGRRRFDRLWIFGLGALLPTALLLGYNQLAFGSPADMGYFHHVIPEFARVHNPRNPLGLGLPDWSRLGPLLWGPYRGLWFYAPILLASPAGWILLLMRRRWSTALVSMGTVAAVLLVNLSYPEWTGGWSTGPRLLVPLIPFAMIPVAGLMAGSSPAARVATILVAGLALLGGAEMLLFQGVGARIPPGEPDPLRVVWRLWTGSSPLPEWWVDPRARFCRNLVSLAAPEWMTQLDPPRQFIQFLPLVLGQGFAILVLGRFGLRGTCTGEPQTGAPPPGAGEAGRMPRSLPRVGSDPER